MNHLGDSSSPYLLQHLDNPVEWWPWCDEALQLAREQNKPILLSIGYSACHWCHVMAHESFEDDETAALMNSLFVNIKVDREERPDLDRIYQSAHHLLNRRAGGWPLTLFLTPDDQVPFFAGTYFPPEPRYGMLSFKELLDRIDKAFTSQQKEIREQNRTLQATLMRQESAEASTDVTLDAQLGVQAVTGLTRLYDSVNGGFGSSPKFPHPSNLEFLLQYKHTKQHPDGLEMALHTLKSMANGGMNDQLGGGFCRYSVDEYWMIPHFEKMLYDNGSLLSLYADAYRATGDALFDWVCATTGDWLIREMQAPAGGYYSSLDADSEGVEGKFYSWQRSEIKALLDEVEFSVIEKQFGLDREPNFEGQWHLHRYQEIDAVADDMQISLESVHAHTQSAMSKLFAEREKRVRPDCDDKILTSWNALVIKGMARYANYSGRKDIIASAESALNFIISSMWQNGRLLAVSKDGNSRLNAYLDDHAYLIDALLEMLQLRWQSRDLEFAIELAELLLEQFEDQKGGFCFTSSDHERLMHRPKSYTDDAMPSGSGIAVRVLLRLGYLLGESRYLDAAARALENAAAQIAGFPDGHCTQLMALAEYLEPTEILVMRGTQEQLQVWRQQLLSDYQPSTLVFAIPDDVALPSQMGDKKPQAGGVIYPCRGTSCSMPVDSIAAVERHRGSLNAPLHESMESSDS